jgi:hypothetical protein
VAVYCDGSPIMQMITFNAQAEEAYELFKTAAQTLEELAKTSIMDRGHLN